MRVRRQFETNVYGPLFASQAVLPGMRSRRSGTIVNVSSIDVSSIAGQCASPTGGLYAASKFALEGFSEALSAEESEFGITILIVEPGVFRTDFLHVRAMVTNEKGVGQDTPSRMFSKTVEHWRAYNGKQIGDPEKGVEIIFQVVTGEGEFGGLKGDILRLPLGKDALARIEGKIESVKRDSEEARTAASSTDFETLS